MMNYHIRCISELYSESIVYCAKNRKVAGSIPNDVIALLQFT
jgi:hypothetical protein